MVALIIISVISLLYFIVMLSVRQGLGKMKTGSSNQLPTVTVVVSLKNEESNISKLESTFQQINYPKELLNFILVDDGSTDATWEKLKAVSLPNTQVIQNDGVGKKSAIEKAVGLSQTEWILTTDADCNISSNWIYGMTSSVDSSTKMVLGPVFIENPKSFLDHLQSIEFFGLQGATAGMAARNTPISANGANMMYRKSIFEELKPYESNKQWLTGDDQFMLMTVQKAYPGSINYAWNPDAIVRTAPVKSINRYFKQRIRWASKGGSYTDYFPQLIGFLVVLFSLGYFYALYERIFNHVTEGMIIWAGVRILADSIVVFPTAKLAGEKVPSVYYLLSMICYPFVVLISFLGGLKVFFTLKKPQTNQKNW